MPVAMDGRAVRRKKKRVHRLGDFSENSHAEPGSIMKELARRLCSLYLQKEIKTDKIYLDSIFLEKRRD